MPWREMLQPNQVTVLRHAAPARSLPPAALYDTSQLHGVSLPPQLLPAPDDCSSPVLACAQVVGTAETKTSQLQAVSLPPQLLGSQASRA